MEEKAFDKVKGKAISFISKNKKLCIIVGVALIAFIVLIAACSGPSLPDIKGVYISGYGQRESFALYKIELQPTGNAEVDEYFEQYKYHIASIGHEKGDIVSVNTTYFGPNITKDDAIKNWAKNGVELKAEILDVVEYLPVELEETPVAGKYQLTYYEVNTVMQQDYSWDHVVARIYKTKSEALSCAKESQKTLDENDIQSITYFD